MVNQDRILWRIRKTKLGQISSEFPVFDIFRKIPEDFKRIGCLRLHEPKKTDTFWPYWPDSKNLKKLEELPIRQNVKCFLFSVFHMVAATQSTIGF